ncbi:hypothetical protein JOD97_001668 [Duganella sp. 1411]|uniref:hypothetical protein n=1 Tax=Duganella sp. 1411 TaxID=2806572 RepID=UPI001AE4BC83|nr:hypothetical protein [Duganella sp. 1411]MBP1203654.1 hypothetical protein [Duganella sp. 1411]
MRDLYKNEVAVVSGAGALSTTPIILGIEVSHAPIVITIPMPPPIYEFPTVPRT